ncbi:HigA family addiction module antitoxin [Dolichospermum circinale CS-1225]|uniref:HigA family addiction module antitoxin n=1 Tax=Dolichospermum circinale TaxID=109265 RepID=UPI0004251894|nr:HigA family addiction module antitoxin [Dolichospermum circinale]MDB9457368.1 HigA family addiction module antitoxin [Dolichospermum circinale CS-545/17]MDB9466397.1 HigA family addiction module antitoxin [Dolichospermum circinale CS-539/09]MDB9470031.1 HigA family addiction module antitoxin [Dolichospermum circinale CS-539]MDB9521276.1 HigA family addiction module antitoxin [Dolichospermum circinale CS-1225]
MNNLQDITQDRLVRPIHPGEVIADILDDLEINPSNFAEVLGVSHQTIQEIINGEISITVDIAIRLGKALGNGPRLWLNLQQKVDVWDALQSHKEEYEQVMTLV